MQTFYIQAPNQVKYTVVTLIIQQKSLNAKFSKGIQGREHQLIIIKLFSEFWSVKLANKLTGTTPSLGLHKLISLK